LLQNTDSFAYQVVALNPSRAERVSSSHTISGNVPQDGNWLFQQLSDFNQDGKTDILVRHKDDGRWKGFLLNGQGGLVAGSGNITMSKDLNWVVVPKEEEDETSLLDNDFNGDGFGDVLIRKNTGQWWLYLLNGSRGVIAGSGGVGLTNGADWQLAAKADFNGDGFMDVLLRNQSTGAWYLYHLNGARGFASGSGQIGLSKNLDYQFKAAADFNGDGNTDVLVRNTSTGSWYLYQLNGARGLISGTGAIGMTKSLNYEFTAVEDFNDDGNPDVLVRNNSTGSWYLYHLNGARRFAAGSGGLSMTKSLNYEFKAAADFNNDGKPDVLVRNTSTGTWFLYHFNGARGSASGSGQVKLSADTDYEFKVAQDFNGDGKVDVLVRNASTGKWYLYHLNGNRLFAAGSGGVGMTSSGDWSYR